MNKKIILAVSLLFFSLTAQAADITGVYECKGHDPFANISYNGRTTVKKTGEVYSFTWDFGKNEIGIH